MPHFNRQFPGDPTAHSGVWAPSTSTANFCEEDYVFTQYIAEFINSLTNLAYVYYALKKHQPYARRNRPQLLKESRAEVKPRHGLDTMSVALLLVGVASFVFHSCLRQIPMRCDDLSMLLLTGSFVQAAYGIGKSRTDKAFVVISGITWAAIISASAMYLATGSIAFHFVLFSVTLSSSIPGVAMRVLYGTGPGFGAKMGSQKGKKEEEELRTALRTRLIWAGFWFILGFFLWNIDLEFCAELRRIRAALGLPWGWFFELHGWWHILTAKGAAEFMDVIRDLEDDASWSDVKKSA